VRELRRAKLQQLLIDLAVVLAEARAEPVGAAGRGLKFRHNAGEAHIDRGLPVDRDRVGFQHPARKELDNLYSIRLVLEGLATRQAAKHITSDKLEALETWNEQMKSYWLKQRNEEALQAGRSFHAAIYGASQNENLAVLLLRLGDQIARYRYYSIVHRVPEAHEDHSAILAALRAHDPEQAEALSRAHVEVEHRLVLSKMRERLESDASAQLVG